MANLLKFYEPTVQVAPHKLSPNESNSLSQPISHEKSEFIISYNQSHPNGTVLT